MNFDIHIRALIVNIKEYSANCTVLTTHIKIFTVKTLEFGHVSTPSYGSSSGRVHQYLYKI